MTSLEFELVQAQDKIHMSLSYDMKDHYVIHQSYNKKTESTINLDKNQLTKLFCMS